MADLKYDTEQMRESAKKYREAADTMDSLKDDLKSSISNLRDNDWKSAAGEAFLEMYEDGWADSVKNYVAVLKGMADLLDRAAEDYDSVTRKLGTIEGIDSRA